MALLVRNEEFECKYRLNEVFGLETEDVKDVIMQGLFARKTCTSHHPRIYPGLTQWAETIRALRDKTLPMGWSSSDDNNFPLSIHPSGNIVVAVHTGDKDAGISGNNPSNRAAKGTNTEQAIWTNQKQLSLFDALPEIPLVHGSANRIMWILLYHVTPYEIRFELSLPFDIVDGKIRSWHERLVFPAITLDQIDIEIGDNNGGNDNGQEFDIDVERKS
ncbi:hypothetical protein [Nitrosovibrio tenuis]|uniref:Uncharacterized protein n=1 Tax=Nitrosovibrio tenuis TaxID=1233 RepID=A0A1H7PB19_9PROT|nr:hypothetical protein [Nitrosovibrio tenuis]SEL32287.1 hypothetical protein SAMN05216387_10898 [Nitrosovibrio tenuis]